MFARSDFGCAYCQASCLSHREAEQHRRRCGPKWRREYGGRRMPTRDERIAQAALAVGDEQ